MFSVFKTQWGGNRVERQNRRGRRCGVAYTKRNAQFSADLVESAREGFTTGLCQIHQIAKDAMYV